MKILDKKTRWNFFRNSVIFMTYSVVIVVAFYFSYLIRFDFNFDKINEYDDNIFSALCLMWGINIFSLILFRQFKTFISYFHMRDMILLVWSQIFVFALFFVVSVFFPYFKISRGVMLVCFITTLASLSVLRIGLRMLRERLSYSSSGETPIVKSRVAIIGAGDLGASLVSDLLAKRHLGVEPVIFLDDDFTKIGHQISGIDVLKIPADFLSLKRQYLIDKAIVTTSKIPASRLSDITTALSRVGISVMIQPSYFDFAVGRTKLAPVREVNVLDVLGR